MSITRRAITMLVGLSLLAGPVPSSLAYERPGKNEWVSVTHDGSPPQRGAVNPEIWGSPVMSADGRYVVFASDVKNLVRHGPTEALPGPVDGPFMVYRRDMKLGRTEPVSVNSYGHWPIPGLCLFDYRLSPSVSADGRFVSFTSCALNLVPGDTNLADDVFVRDMKRGLTSRASVASDGAEGDWFSYSSPGSMAANGRVVTFASGATNLVEDDSNFEEPDVFVRCLRVCGGADRTEIVSVSSAGTQGAPWDPSDCVLPQPDLECILGGPTKPTPLRCNEETAPAISGNGRFVAFSSPLDGLVENDPGGANVFVRDRRLGKTTLIDVSTSGDPAGPPGPCLGSGGPSISNDGRFVSFHSTAGNLVPNDSNSAGLLSHDIFVRDRKSKRTTRVSVTSTGEEGTSQQLQPTGVIAQGSDISDDGRLVTFMSRADNYGPPDRKDGEYDVFVHDQATGAIELLSYTHEGGPGHGYSEVGVVNGRYAVFKSQAPGLVKGDADPESFDFFRRDLGDHLTAGGLGGSSRPKQEPSDDRICITQDVCVPPGAIVSSSDSSRDLGSALSDQGGDLYGASLVYRPQYSDLFVTIELDHMPMVTPVASPIFYGLRFKSQRGSYEVRATSLNQGTFGLFDCTGGPACTKVADLQGGYGTTGERVVFSLPLEEIRLGAAGDLQNVVAFSGLGSYLTGATKILDAVRLK